MPRTTLLWVCALLVACGDDAAVAPDATGGAEPDAVADAAPDAGPDVLDEPAVDLEGQQAILAVSETERWTLDGLEDEVHVVRTEAGVPHLYATNRADLARVQGFVLARDRFFMMDLSRRLALGRLSELLGDLGLETDVESRATGMTHVADRVLAHLPDHHAAWFDAFAEGVNAYIDAVAAGELPAPSELPIATALLNVATEVELMLPFTRRDVAGMVATLLYQSSYETGDVGRAAAHAQMATAYEGADAADLRLAGAWTDLFGHVAPFELLSSAPAWGLQSAATTAPPLRGTPSAPLPASLADRLLPRLDRLALRLLRDRWSGYGSNAWAVAGTHTVDGAALLAGDGHLSLSVPSVLYQIGMDTALFGGGDTHQLGLTVPGMPFLPIGTNGEVAWSQTQLGGDITDWYREELQLGPDGRPSATYFQGAWEPVVQREEVYDIAEVPAFDSVGRTETWPRWETFDGRWIADIEGRSADVDEALADGEALVRLEGGLVVPGDTDGDGVVTAISFDYTGLDAARILDATDGFGHAGDVEEFRQLTRYLNGYSQNFTVADRHGDVLYTAYQGVPCREYLPRDEDGRWAPGADPAMLLDGTQYGGFEIPVDADGRIDEAPGQTDPYRCVVPFDAWPQVISPPEGYVVTANHDPGGMTLDDDLLNEPYYIGGPWALGLRAARITELVEEAIDADAAGVAAMATIQDDDRSALAVRFAADLLEAIAAAREADGPLGALYDAAPETYDAVEARLTAWGGRGYEARSGVETFYASPTTDDVADAVATTIFNAWFPRVVQGVFDDEGLPGLWQPGGDKGRILSLRRLLDGRGPDNPAGLASWNPDTQESIFFDTLGTPEVETSREIVLLALADALAYLESPPTGPGTGGYGSDDMDTWLWGLRHLVKLESLLAEFLGDDPAYALITGLFAISTDVHPLADSYEPGDPRAGLPWFPRDGDNFGVDAANPGMSGKHPDYGSGPVMRMVVALHADGTITGQNVIPGGQSALVDSPHFADQVPLWLANEAMPMRLHPLDVAAGATGREVYEPPGSSEAR